MNVTEAVRQRISTRAFLDKPISKAELSELLEIAQRAPSGGNLQPWCIDVVQGAPMTELKNIMKTRVIEAPNGDEVTDYSIYPADLWSPYRFYAPVDGEGEIVDATTRRFVGYFTGAVEVPEELPLLDIIIDNGNLPECAMQVWRDEEIGPLYSRQAEAPCG